MQVHLIRVHGEPEGEDIRVPPPEFVIGRDTKCDLCLTQSTVSRTHCEILQQDADVLVKDLNSTNGTYVNDARVLDEAVVHDGELLQVGPLVFEIKITDGEDSEESSAECHEETDRLLVGAV